MHEGLARGLTGLLPLDEMLQTSRARHGTDQKGRSELLVSLWPSKAYSVLESVTHGMHLFCVALGSTGAV